ncbi:MAG: DMT family transporter [Gammaproteobacteria bacterium]|nr:DMT family transporter [Gammaproteobacteria bacterium]MDH3537392.1 DMT family transporter [Gammaproteobacteria bacterium]
MFWEPADIAINPVHRPFAGILFCVFALFAFALQDSIIKYLSERYSVIEILTLRLAIVLTLLVVIGVAWQGFGILRSRRPRLMFARGVLAFFAFTIYYIALSRIPLADAAAVYMTAPLFVTLLSALVLRERVGVARWSAVVIGFSAVLYMLNPGSSLFRIESALPLFSAMCYAFIPIINRHIGLSEHALTMGIYTSTAYFLLMILTSLAISALPEPSSDNSTLQGVFQDWMMLRSADWLLLLLAGVIFAAALLSITQAYRIAAVSTVAPFEYVYILWASVIGYLMFSDVPGARTLVGSVVIVACGCYIIYRERERRRRSAAAVANPGKAQN